MNDSGKKVQFTKSNIYIDDDRYYKFQSEQYYLASSYTKDHFPTLNEACKIAYNLGYDLLTDDEWRYIIYHHSIGLCTINSTSTMYGDTDLYQATGLLILPDNWTLPSGCSFDGSCTSYGDNTYNVSQWAAMEKSGAVFLPAAGYSESTVGLRGVYWSSTPYGASGGAYLLFLGESDVIVVARDNLVGDSYSVRPVKYVD